MRSDDLGYYYEVLSLDSEHTNLERFRNGAPVLDNHQRKSVRDVLGLITRFWVESDEAGATLKFSTRSDVEPIWNDITEGIIRNVSVGYTVGQYEKIGERGDLPVLRAIKNEFYEVSVAPIGADPATFTRNFQDNEGEVLPLGKEKVKESNGDEGKEDPVEKERARILAITKRCRAHDLPSDLQLRLVDDGTSEPEANSIILGELEKRGAAIANQGASPRIDLVRDEAETRRESFRTAIIHEFKPELVDESAINEGAREYMGRSLIDMLRVDLERQGIRASGLKSNDIVTRAFHSTSDFPLLMGDVANVVLKKSYLSLRKEQTFRPLVRYQNAKNFKPMRKLQMGEIPSLEKIPEGAEVTYGSVSEHGEQWAIGSYGKAFSITRETIINDELDAILSTMSAWGAAASRLESNLVWGVFNTNPMVYKLNSDGINAPTGNRWFSEEHGNMSDAAPLTLTSIEDAEFAMSVQQGHDRREGDELNIRPRYLIVPSRLKNTARKLIFGQYTPTAVEGVNIYQDQFTIISEARLNPTMRGTDAKYPWYMACDPNVLPVVWMAYRDNQREPEVMYNTDFATRSVQVRADLDVGVTHGDWRAVHMNPGATRADQLAATNLALAEGA